MTLVDHFERRLGRISGGGLRKIGGAQIVHYEDGQFRDVEAWSTLGMSRHVLAVRGTGNRYVLETPRELLIKPTPSIGLRVRSSAIALERAQVPTAIDALGDQDQWKEHAPRAPAGARQRAQREAHVSVVVPVDDERFLP